MTANCRRGDIYIFGSRAKTAPPGRLAPTSMPDQAAPPLAAASRSSVNGGHAQRSKDIVVKSEPVEEMDLFASDWSLSNREELGSLATGGQGAASGSVASPLAGASTKRAPDDQTAVTKRVRFALVAPLDEGDVEYVCGING